MDAQQIRQLQPRLDEYLARFNDCFGRCDTRQHFPVYVKGQLSDLRQKSVELKNTRSSCNWAHPHY